MKLKAVLAIIAVLILSTLPVFAEEVDTSKNLTVSIWQIPDDLKYYSGYAQNPVVAYLAEHFNLTFEYQQPPMGSEQDQFNLMLGTGEYTDFFQTSYSQESMESLYEDGVIQDLAPYLEKYMPNLYAFLQENSEARASLYDDNGHLFVLPIINTFTDNWGGLVYRRDILDTMTGGYVSFPSGNDEPTTLEDWDYMLPLMKAYFEAAGMADSACLILPPIGYFQTGELLGGFGVGGATYIKEDGTLGFGPAEDGFYNYLVKMKEWYDLGYVYQDFASRTNDVFYLPNTALTYGGAAGIWYGLTSQLGTSMSLPEYGLNMLVNALPAPLDTAHGVTPEEAGIHIYNGVATNSSGFAASITCSEEKLIRYLNAIDFLFTDEGSKLRVYGLDKEHGSADNAILVQLGLQDGCWFVNGDGELEMAPVLSNDPAINIDVIRGNRLPGFTRLPLTRNCELQDGVNVSQVAGTVWSKYGEDNVFPTGVTLTAEESSQASTLYTTMADYINSMVPKFIMGTEELNEDSFNQFRSQLASFGLDEYLGIQKTAYERYLGRME